MRGRAADVPPEIRQPSLRVLKHGERAQRTMSGNGEVQSEGSYHPPSVVMIGLRLFSFLRQLIRLFSLVSVKTNHKKRMVIYKHIQLYVVVGYPVIEQAPRLPLPTTGLRPISLL